LSHAVSRQPAPPVGQSKRKVNQGTHHPGFRHVPNTGEKMNKRFPITILSLGIVMLVFATGARSRQQIKQKLSRKKHRSLSSV
jgi:hypothetical protein